MKLPDHILKGIEESNERMNHMSRWDRQRLRWAGLARIYGLNIPDGVNPKRLKKYRRLVARKDTEMAKKFKEARRACQAHRPMTLQELMDGMSLAS
jgi:hypothetical protein